ncbi:MAG: hypothetical protein HY394_01675 [Candidatus Diapherotrites archaeon]|nr:hypothetical protein [Candidatus Diapherotrites archaeon]
MFGKPIAFLMFVALFAAFASAASCDVSATPAIVDIDNDYGANAGRVTVFGEGLAGGFNGNTKVEVNCNAGNALPGANEDAVTARIAAYTSTTLSYSGAYCTYKASGKDVDYKVSAKIFLDDVVCSGGYCFTDITCKNGANDYAAVTVKASSKAGTAPAPAPSPAPAPTPPAQDTSCKNGTVWDRTGYILCGCEGLYACGAAPPNGKTCNGGLVVDSTGRCFKQAQAATGTERELRFALDWTWSLVGVPYAEISSENHSCVSKFYYYDKENGKYRKVTDLKDKSLIGKGLWAKRASPKSASGDCTIKYTGKFLSEQAIALKKGWNLISIQTEKSFDTAKNTSCSILKGPLTYSGFIENGKPQGYYKRDQLNAGTGYWIKVADDCILGSEDGEEAPPAAPESTDEITASQDSGITPQGTRGRRYIEDAG